VPDRFHASFRRLPALLALLGLAAIAARPAAASVCLPVRRAELPVTLQHGFLLVPAALDGRQVMMVVDTGAEATTISPDAVKLLGLAWQPSRTVLLGVGGTVRGGGTVRLQRLQLGGLVRDRLALPVSTLPPVDGAGQMVAGLLGADVLGGFDIALDLPRHTMTLYALPPCPGFVPPGYAAADGSELQPAVSGLLFLPARIDGSAVRALLDTGARHSLLDRLVAARLGVTGLDLAFDPVVRGRGVGSAALAFRRHRFAEVRVGGVAVRNMPVNVAALPIPGIDMLLGADWLAGHAVWISRAAKRLFQR
jgi:predicted aspartyl protease